MAHRLRQSSGSVSAEYRPIKYMAYISHARLL